MKKFFFSISTILLASVASQAQTLGDVINIFTGNSKTNTNTNNTSYSGNLSNAQVVSGLREALRIGAQNASGKLTLTDGFFKNMAVKILMPAEVRQVESTLRSVGMGSIVDKAILSMNRAAEDASKKAAPIFVNAISGMTLQDGFSILSGGNTAATNYLKLKTTDQLTQAFRPVVQQSLQKFNVTALWNTVFSTYNRLPLGTQKVNPDLTSYVVGKALDGMFYSIAQEEMKIRTDPAAQVTNLLKQVFGSKK